MMPSPPLRFLILSIGGWVCLRTGLLGSAWWMGQQEVAPAPSTAPAAALVQTAPTPAENIQPAATSRFRSETSMPSRRKAAAPFSLPDLGAMSWDLIPSDFQMTLGRRVADGTARIASEPPILASVQQSASRWSASAWIFGREQGLAGLTPGGTLGGSQAGGRISYRLNRSTARPLALSVRGYAPLDSIEGAEVAAGLNLKPLAQLPLHLLVERRHALGGEGRSAFSVTGYSGVSDVDAGPLRIDAYAQGGVVGTRSRDLFADGSARVSLPIGRLKIGAGAWGAVQPGVSRIDVGPQAAIRLPGNITLAADWRQRVSGNAAPHSGPTLTLSTGF